MIGPGFGAPGQRESIKGGRDQDLLTPVWQTVALCFCGVWIIGWLAATAMVMGAMLGYVLSLAAFVVRWGRKIARDWETEYTYTSYAAYFGWILLNLTIHICIGYGGDLIWTSYVMPWSPWQKLWFVLISVAMSVPFGVLGYVLIVRLFDPNYPSPRKAVDQRQPQMPWYRDAFPLDVKQLEPPAREELDVRITDETGDPEQPDVAMCLLFSPAGHPENLARYARALLSTDATRAAFSYAGGKHINGAKFYMYTPDEFEELETEAKRAGLVKRERSNQPYKLTDRGRFVFARVAERNLESASVSPTPEAWG